jgi:acyl-CoA thioesterase I
VLLGLGGNDMLRGISPTETRANLAAMLDELKRRNILVVLTGMQAAPNMGPDYARDFNPIYADLAKEYGVPLYPFFLDGVVTAKGMMLNDGMHPNAKGVEAVVGKLTPVVAGALAE